MHTEHLASVRHEQTDELSVKDQKTKVKSLTMTTGRSSSHENISVICHGATHYIPYSRSNAR
jgi:hypothetical protein